MKRLLAAVFAAAAALSVAPAHAEPGPGPGMCMYLGARYNVWYPCTDPPPWLLYGQGGNPPYGSPLPASECAPPMQHDVGCSYARNRSGPRNVVTGVRQLEVIDRELSLLAVVRAVVRREGGRPSAETIDGLLDERLNAAHAGRAVQHSAR